MITLHQNSCHLHMGYC